MACRDSLAHIEMQLAETLRSLSARDAEVERIPFDIHRAVQSGTDSDGLAILVTLLSTAPELSEFEGAMHSFGSSATRISPAMLAHWLILRSHESSPSDAIAALCEYVHAVDLNLTGVVAVGGIKVEAPIDMGRGTWLIPWTALSASSSKSSIDNSFLMSFAHRPSAALTRQLSRPKQVFRDGEPRVHNPVDYGTHDDVLLLLTLVGPTSPFPVGYWVDPPHYAPIFGLGMTFPHIEGYSESRKVPADAGSRVQALLERWNALPQARRDELRVPISRLNSAMRRTKPVDAAIDLGIALESFFLSDQSGTQGEMSFRIRVRAARWMGSTKAERDVISKLVNRLYDIRSKAVHTGRVGSKLSALEVQTLLIEGYSLIANSITKALAGPAPVWDAVVLE